MALLLVFGILFYAVSLVLAAICVHKASSRLEKLEFLFYVLSIVLFLVYGLNETELLLLSLLLLCVSQFRWKETQA